LLRPSGRSLCLGLRASIYAGRAGSASKVLVVGLGVVVGGLWLVWQYAPFRWPVFACYADFADIPTAPVEMLVLLSVVAI
jgi:hypothetical protein